MTKAQKLDKLRAAIRRQQAHRAILHRQIAKLAADGRPRRELRAASEVRIKALDEVILKAGAKLQRATGRQYGEVRG